MADFNYNSFVDITQVFNWRKGEVVVRPKKEPLALFAVEGIHPQSKFVDLNVYRATVKSRFVPVPAVAVAVAVAAPVAPAPEAVIIVSASVMPAVEEAPAIVPVPQQPVSSTEETSKPRATLKLKTKVELPPIVTPARQILEDAPSEQRRRHPLSEKSWAELLAEAEAATTRKSRSNIDLAAAFKSEMRAFMAEQEKLGDSQFVSPRFRTASEQKAANAQSDMPIYRPAPAKIRILAA